MNKVIIANWKMNPQTVKEAEVLFSKLSNEKKNNKKLDIIVCPPFPFLFLYKKLKIKNINLGIQNISKDPSGSFTGEVSLKMATDLGVSSVILGHSERREMGENNILINKKLINALKYKLLPILCIGEINRDNDGLYLAFIEKQIKGCLLNISKSQVKNIIIAYEPVWAIGVNAIGQMNGEQFVEMKIFIKKVISDIYDSKTAHSIRILYGGSVNSSNASVYIKSGADGLLIGRDSLNAQKFGLILNTIK